MFSGCLDLPARWDKVHVDELAAREGRCRSYGFVPGDLKFSRCVIDDDQAASDRAQRERVAAMTASEAAERARLKGSHEAELPPLGGNCGVLQDGQYSCVDQ